MRLGNGSGASAGILVCVSSEMTNQQPCGSTLSSIYATSSRRGHLNHPNRQMRALGHNKSFCGMLF